ncbi:MAG: hypothetical protein HQM07_03445 [Zetaproteobacteria bacterium]|nr:hypothetical protein [Zetaproteobacteria bacterium]
MMISSNYSMSAYGSLNNITTSHRVTADNIANVTNVDYQEKSATMTEQGVVVTLSADAQVKNNVNLEKNITNMLNDKHAFAANIAVIKTNDEMHKTLLDIVA